MLYQTDFANGTHRLELGAGEWQAQDGALRQTSDGDRLPRHAATRAGPTTPTREGAQDRRRRRLPDPLPRPGSPTTTSGGTSAAGTTRARALERAQNGAKREIGRPRRSPSKPAAGTTSASRSQGRRIRCYLDDKLVTDALTDRRPRPPTRVYATASRDNATGDSHLKVVNFAPTTAAAGRLQGVRERGEDGPRRSHLHGQPADVNTLAEPRKVAPQTVTSTAAAAVSSTSSRPIR